MRLEKSCVGVGLLCVELICSGTEKYGKEVKRRSIGKRSDGVDVRRVVKNGKGLAMQWSCVDPEGYGKARRGVAAK